jgi:hypothetical protein
MRRSSARVEARIAVAVISSRFRCSAGFALAASLALVAATLTAIAPAAAQSQGPNFPSTVVDDPSTGTVTWNVPGNAAASDNVEAAAGGLLGAASHYLKATGFGFAIPAGAVIEGIQVGVERRGIDVWDAKARIVKAGSIGTTDKAYLGGYPAGVWDFGEMVALYGGSGDLWGETWTPADINDANFGFALSAFGGDGLAAVDSISISVFYSSAQCGNNQPRQRGAMRRRQHRQR